MKEQQDACQLYHIYLTCRNIDLVTSPLYMSLVDIFGPEGYRSTLVSSAAMVSPQRRSNCMCRGNDYRRLLILHYQRTFISFLQKLK